MVSVIFDSKENKVLFESDVKALIWAFFPDEEVKSSFEEEMSGSFKLEAAASDESIHIGFMQYRDGEEEAQEGDIVVTVLFRGRLKSMPVFFWEGEKENHALRRSLKWLLYRSISEGLKRELPWGSLTGVRPVRLMVKQLETGLSEEEACDFFRREYLVGEEKTALALDIAKRQRALLKGSMDERHYSLYIGIPFCPTTCLYCSFTSYPAAAYAGLMEEYVNTLLYELEKGAELFKDRILDSVYIGGGTPSALEPGQIDRLLSKLEEYYDLTNNREITFEAGRPDSITREKLEILNKHGVSRISINPQTMNEETLKLIGRHHSPQQTREAFHLAREMGFEDINMDIILGLPGEGEAELAYTLEEIKKLSPDSLTIHSLAVKRGSRLHEQLLLKQIDMSGSHITDKMIDMCHRAVEAMDMKPYYLYRQKKIKDNFENTGYAREGKECHYNIVTMEEVQSIVACGAGTVSKRVYPDGKIERCDNVKDVELYVSKIGEMIERKRELFF